MLNILFKLFICLGKSLFISFFFFLEMFIKFVCLFLGFGCFLIKLFLVKLFIIIVILLLVERVFFNILLIFKFFL